MDTEKKILVKLETSFVSEINRIRHFQFCENILVLFCRFEKLLSLRIK